MPKLNEKKKIIAEMFEDALTREEFLQATEQLAKHVKKIEEKNASELQAIAKALVEASKQTSQSLMNDFGNLKGDAGQTIQGLLSNVSQTLNEQIRKIEDRLSQIKDGKDADEDIIVDKVLKSIKLPEIPSIEEDLPKMGERIRDALELLQGEERLKVSAIDGLEEMIAGIKGPATLGAYPWSVQTGIETPSGTLNGSNTAFTVVHKPEFITLQGQMIYEGNGYSYANNTITLDIAPASGQVLRSHYKVI